MGKVPFDGVIDAQRMLLRHGLERAALSLRVGGTTPTLMAKGTAKMEAIDPISSTLQIG
jgi:hypothetical protein